MTSPIICYFSSFTLLMTAWSKWHFSRKTSTDRRLHLWLKHQNKQWEILPALLHYSVPGLCVSLPDTLENNSFTKGLISNHEDSLLNSALSTDVSQWYHVTMVQMYFCYLDFSPSFFPLSAILAWLALLWSAGWRGSWDRLFLTSSTFCFKPFCTEYKSLNVFQKCQVC